LVAMNMSTEKEIEDARSPPLSLPENQEYNEEDNKRINSGKGEDGSSSTAQIDKNGIAKILEYRLARTCWGK